MVALTDGTLVRLNRLFREADRAEAINLLLKDCTAESMHFSCYNEHELERFHFAALKLSDGKLDALVDAITLAQIDYRDLLMAAGFGEVFMHI
ncbi:MAG TPA: hypothetical protein VHU84_15155 [Lacipirellulaceae bacterium]|jgi:hypothetical protein|nr:hypothetical protein [Lacipirellulaceae bacterium]